MKEESCKKGGILEGIKIYFFNWMSFEVLMLWPERWWTLLV